MQYTKILPNSSTYMYVTITTVPGDPENAVKGGTTVSGASTVLSSTLQQSFSIQERDCDKTKVNAATPTYTWVWLTMMQFLPMCT